MAQKHIANPTCSDYNDSESACSATARHTEQLRAIGCAIAFQGFAHIETFLSIFLYCGKIKKNKKSGELERRMDQGSVSMFKQNSRSRCTFCVWPDHSRGALICGEFEIACLCWFWKDLFLRYDFSKMLCGCLSFFWKMVSRLNETP